MPTSNINVNHDDNVEVIFKPKRKPKWLFHYRAIGATNMLDSLSIDAIECIAEFNKGELCLLKHVKRNIAVDNKVVIKLSTLPIKEKPKVQPAIKRWLDKHLWVRITQEHYLVNPYFFTPERKYHESTLQYWDELKPKDQFNQYI